MENIWGNNSIDSSELKANVEQPPVDGNQGIITSEITRVQTIVQDLLKSSVDQAETTTKMSLAAQNEKLHLQNLAATPFGSGHPTKK
jgi:hypothetical protein